MRTPHKRNAPGANRGASDNQGLQFGLPENTKPKLPDLQALETLAEWRESLDIKFRRAQLEYGLVGKDSTELRALYSEGQAWKRVCRALLHEEGGAAA